MQIDSKMIDQKKLNVKEINFLKELDNSVLRFKHGLPHHNDSLLNKLLIEKFIAEYKLEFYESYKDLSDKYNYIYEKNKLVYERLEYITNIFYDMQKDMDYLDSEISKIGNVEKGLNFRRYLDKFKKNYKFQTKQSQKYNLSIPKYEIKSRNRRELILSEYSEEGMYLLSIKRSLAQVYKKRINKEVKRLKKDIYDLRKDMKVDENYYDTKFKIAYLIPGVGQLSFNQLYKFLIMITITLVCVFIIIGDLEITKVDVVSMSVLLILEAINIYDFKKICSNIKKGIRPNNINETFIDARLKIKSAFTGNSKLVYYLICTVFVIMSSVVIFANLYNGSVSFLQKYISRLITQFDPLVVGVCIVLAIIAFAISEIISMINWRIFSRVDKEFNLFMFIISALSLVILLVFPNDFLFKLYFDRHGQYVLHDSSLILLFVLTTVLIVNTQVFLNVYSIEKAGFLAYNVKYLMHNDNLTNRQYYKWIVFPQYASRIKFQTLGLNFLAYYMMFCLSGVYIDHMIDIYYDSSIDVVQFFYNLLDRSYYFLVAFFIVAFLSILLLIWNISIKNKVRR